MVNDPNREAFLRVLEAVPELGGRFTAIQRIDARGGSGHFSLLFRAFDAVSKKQVAIKVFHPGQIGDRYRLASFIRESDLLARYCGHRDLVEILAPAEQVDLALTTGTGADISLAYHYYALELADGDLGGTIAAGGLEPEDALIVFHQVCRAVQRLHADRVVNRDIKPQNVLLFGDGVARLSDLGTARDMDAVPLVTEYGTFWPGDLRYAPPEMVAGLFGERPDLAFGADFFALGAVLFEMLARASLAGLLFDARFAMDLAAHMALVPSGRRSDVYDQFVVALARAHPLPRIELANPAFPRCIRQMVNGLYADLCSIDYRTRLRSFQSVFRRTRAAVLILRHDRRSAMRRQRRAEGGRPDLVPAVMERIKR